MPDFDFMEHIRLQQELTHETLAAKPDGLTHYEIVVRFEVDEMQLQVIPPFELTEDATEAVREMFLFNQQNGQNIIGMRLKFTEADGGSWKMASDYEHA